LSKVGIVSIGAAVQDVFLSGKVLTPVKEDGQWVEELPIGGKADVDKIVFSTGGGATNAAVTFSRHGMNSKFMGQIGHDPAGAAVIAELKKEKVNTDLVVYDKEFATAYSVVLLAPNGGRTILTYRGASTHYKIDKFKLNDAHADWFYISSLAGNMDLLEKLVHHAADRHIKVAVNPGKGELKHATRLKKLLDKITILSANKEETAQLFEADNSWDLVRQATEIVPIVVVTDGPNGVVAGDRDNNQICGGGMYEDIPVIDRTGAGDAFASGFTAKIASGAKLHDAVVFASANSTSVVAQIGAKEGILKADTHLHSMDMHCEPLK